MYVFQILRKASPSLALSKKKLPRISISFTKATSTRGGGENTQITLFKMRVSLGILNYTLIPPIWGMVVNFTKQDWVKATKVSLVGDTHR
jgi:hypothetical protein